MLGPRLPGEGIDLAPISPDDLPSINRWWGLAEVNHFWGGVGTPSMRQTEEWYERSARSESEVVWAVRCQGRIIGHTFLSMDWRNRGALSGLLIGEPDLWGRGYGSEAVWLRTNFAFGELGLERLESESIAGNVGMHRALERSGYRKFGRKRKVMLRAGEWHDAYLFELLREEWLAADAISGR